MMQETAAALNPDAWLDGSKEPDVEVERVSYDTNAWLVTTRQVSGCTDLCIKRYPGQVRPFVYLRQHYLYSAVRTGVGRETRLAMPPARLVEKAPAYRNLDVVRTHCHFINPVYLHELQCLAKALYDDWVVLGGDIQALNKVGWDTKSIFRSGGQFELILDGLEEKSEIGMLVSRVLREWVNGGTPHVLKEEYRQLHGTSPHEHCTIID